MFRRLLRKKSLDEDLDEELQAHLDMEVRLLGERGFSREDALVEARRSFGNRTQIAESTRESWGWQWLDRLSQDLRYASRTLRHSPAFSSAAVLSLALGIGASTAVFSIADTVFFRPLPYANPERLLWVATAFPHLKTEFLASPDYVAWRRDNTIFEQLAATQAHGGQTMLLNGPDAAELNAVRVSANFLATLGVRPTIGRDFKMNEELPNGPKSILLSHQLWKRKFGAKPDIAGRPLTLDGETYTIIGVLPESFAFPIDTKLDVMTTLPVSPTASHHDLSMAKWAVYGRLKQGVSISQARSDLQLLFARSKADMPLMFRSDTKLVAQPLQEHRAGDAKTLVSILTGAVMCLLLIACVNVSNLLLGRWSARSCEFAVRAAIGAGRSRLARQLLTEALLLTLIGCALSTVLVVAALRGFVRYAEGELPRLSEVTIDGRVFAIGVCVSSLTVLFSTALPIIRAGRIDIQQALQEAGRTGTAAGHRLAKRLLVVAEVALSLILLSGAALLLETLWHLRNDRLGFQPEHVLTLTIPLKGTKVENQNREQLAVDLIAFAKRIPGTEDAAQTECSPLSAGPLVETFSRSDRPQTEAFHRGDNIFVCGVTAGYVKVSGIRVLRGRIFTADDSLHPNTVAVINDTAARAYFPGEDPIGKQIMGKVDGKWKTVIGIVSDTKNAGLESPPEPQAFLNGVVWPEATEMQFIIRSLGDRRAVEVALAKEARTFDEGLAPHFESLDETMSDLTSGPCFNGIVLTTFSAVAVLMAVIGVYGLLTFTVMQRTHEIGIRIALGAERVRILGLVLREGTALVLAGVALGFLGAVALTRYLKTLLYGVGATDPLTFFLVAVGLFAAALIAMFLPARKAVSVDPLVALRHY